MQSLYHNESTEDDRFQYNDLKKNRRYLCFEENTLTISTEKL